MKLTQAEHMKTINALRTAGCVGCGSRPIPLGRLHFVHRRGTRYFSIGDKKHRHTREELNRELAKCDLLCELCREKPVSETEGNAESRVTGGRTHGQSL